jgi:predicted dehydrogenase
MKPPERKVNRREFLQKGAMLAAGTAAASSTALSYNRIVGANNRISLGHIGIGNRGSELDAMVAQLSNSKNVEMTAVCDLWTANRDRAVAANKKYYGRAPRSARHADELFRLEDIDAVLISTPEHSHSLLLNMTVEAGRMPIAKSPWAMFLLRSRLLGRRPCKQADCPSRHTTSQRTLPSRARSQILTGALGQISKYEIVWNYHGPRWRGRPEVKKLREQDTDWHAWLMNKPARPFDPHLYFEYRLYKDFSSGIGDQWMSHGIDLCLYFMDESFPESVVAHGGVFAWQDGRENPDTFQVLLKYPKGFLVSYATSFGNDAPSYTRIMERMARFNTGGEGSPRWQFVEKRGITKRTLTLTRRESKIYPAEIVRSTHGIGDEDHLI